MGNMDVLYNNWKLLIDLLQNGSLDHSSLSCSAVQRKCCVSGEVSNLIAECCGFCGGEGVVADFS